MNNWYGRIILFFIAGAGCILSLGYTTGHFKSDRQIILLNTTRPDFRRLLDLEKQPAATVSRADLREYFDYFHLVNEAMPDNNEGLLMLGYLYEITGDKSQAQSFLNKADHLDPSFFFTEFNLGLLSFEKSDYSRSADILQNALTIPPELTLKRMMNSTIYRQFFSSMDDSRDIIVDLRQAYQDAYVLLNADLKMESRGENANPEVHAHFM